MYKMKLWDEYFFKYEKTEIKYFKPNQGMNHRKRWEEEIVIRTNTSLFEIMKKESDIIVRKQENLITYLNSIIKDIGSISKDGKIYDLLSERTKSYLNKLKAEEEFENIDDSRISKIQFLDDYYAK
jgi:hypothetical protein